VMFAILFGNIFAPLIDEVVIRARMRRYEREG
jgi:Na+-translocating ferredoxin:NAD+ oxidoreductase RnfD subunit